MDERLNKFKALLKAKGMKTTSQRLAILKVLIEQPDKHLTAEEIYDYVKDSWPDIGLATIYRNIQLLSELNLIDKLNLDDGYVRYEIGKMDESGTKHRHHHLICLDCGSIFMFEDDLLDELETKIYESMGFSVSDHEVKLFGHCKACSEIGEKSEK